MEGERKAQEKEDKLKKQVVDKAKRTTQRKKDDEAAEVAKPAVTGEALTQELEKLISDKDIEI